MLLDFKDSLVLKCKVSFYDQVKFQILLFLFFLFWWEDSSFLNWNNLIIRIIRKNKLAFPVTNLIPNLKPQFSWNTPIFYEFLVPFNFWIRNSYLSFSYTLFIDAIWYKSIGKQAVQVDVL